MAGTSASVDVVVVGSVNVDVVLRARRFPRVGETLTGATVLDALGGKGSNQAVAAARLGASVAMVACIGDDAAGRTALDDLRAEGIDVAHCRVTADAPTGRAAIVVDDEGRNSIVVADGANALLGPADVARAASLIARARVVLCQLEVPVATVAHAFAAARAGGALTYLNTAPALPLDELSAPPDALVANRVEAEVLTGQPSDTPPAVLAHALQERLGVRLAIVTDGERGAVGRDGADAITADALTIDARDTTGAGDAFVGALAAYRAAGHPAQAALDAACTAGSLATRTAGAMPSLPRLAELNAALRNA